MKSFQWQIIFGISLIALSVSLYFIQIQLFRTPRDTFFYLFQDLAFVPISVLTVTLIIDQLLRIREKRVLLKKMNMVIGAFFSEVGTILLKSFTDFDLHYDKIRRNLVITNDWSEQDFSIVKKRLGEFDYSVNSEKGDLESLKNFLVGKRDFLLRLLENPNLLEHESFTDVLWAVFHLTEELASRADVRGLPDTDYQHLSGDIKRAYVSLISEWVTYMKHLKTDYPYLFSLAVRTNPFNPDALPEVR
ncbi:MAG: hypothetical protein RDU01_03160 [Thermodesulfovibrionales bacterium]|nr:hypothetical protein [Thermodesulfovibrionales bacterium]